MTSTPKLVETLRGVLRGTCRGGVNAFKGIPYGEGVAGHGRWRRASKPTRWLAIREATAYGPRSVQIEHHQLGVTSQEIEDLLLDGQPADPSWQRQDEECLTLSVWSPCDIGERLPVMVWLHGGGYHGETPPVWWFDGENLARRGRVVVVTIRHRVGPLGYLHLADLPSRGGYDQSGNIGMVDIIQALEWVRDEIKAFGGDPENVTLFGESGGGTKISVLLAMPSARGLFSKAIIQSGPQLPAPTREEGTATAVALLAELGLSAEQVDDLWDVPVERLLKAQVTLMPRIRKPWENVGLAGFQPVVDGDLLMAPPFEPEASVTGRDVPLIIGTCATEASFLASSIPDAFALEAERLPAVLSLLGLEATSLIEEYRKGRVDATATELLLAICTDYFVRINSIRLAERKYRLGAAPVYMYMLRFATDVMGGKFGTPHTMDIPLVFGHPEQSILGSDPGRFAVMEQMITCWSNFARSGNPSPLNGPTWPPYDTIARHTMIFDIVQKVVSDPQVIERLAWR